MNLRDLQYLVAVAELSHFGKAAERCCVSQPTLSMQIKKLEEQLGVQLIERNNKKVLITEIGHLIIQHARRINHEVNNIKDVAQAAINPYVGKLKMALIPTLAPYLLPHIMPVISKHFPELTTHLIEEKTATITTMLKAGELDIAILALPIDEPGLINTPMFDEEFYLAVNNQHPLAKRKRIMSQELQHQRLLLLTEGHCLRDQALDICARVNATEDDTFRATSMETLRHMVAHNVGITLIPQLACHPNDNISYIPLQNPKPKRRIGMLWRNTTPRTQVFNELTTLISKTMVDIMN